MLDNSWRVINAPTSGTNNGPSADQIVAYSPQKLAMARRMAVRGLGTHKPMAKGSV
jgi:hypothetical protein